ncbi:MAG: hypothetical protein ACSLFP_00995 [Acidimicrobiales bacterium]
MSDQQQGPGWWLASDGKWYPPEQAAGASGPPPTDPTAPMAPVPPGPPPTDGSSSGNRTGLIVAGVLVVIALIAAAVLLLGGDDDDGDDIAASTTTTAEPESTTTTGADDTTTTTGSDGLDPADVPDGFTLVEGNGISLVVPDTWEQIDSDDASLSEEELAEAFPGADQDLLQQGLAAFQSGAVLVAIDVSGSDFANNVNVIESPSEFELDFLEVQGRQEIEAVGGVVDEVTRVDLPLGEAVRVTYTLDGVMPDGSSFTVQGIQHYVPFDGSTYIVTVSAVEDLSDIADPMAASLRVL